MDVHQTICTVDIAGFGGMDRTRLNYVAVRTGMYESVQRAFADSGIPWDECFLQHAGDSILVLAPATVPKGAFAGKLPRALLTALEEHNASHAPEEKIKLRLALHAGEVTYDKYGVAGAPVIHASRLLQAQPLREYLASSSGNLGMIVSDWFFTEVIQHRPEYAPDEYRRIDVGATKTDTIGWIRLPGSVLPADLPALTEAPVAGRGHGVQVVAPMLHPASPKFYEVVRALEEIPCMRGEDSRSMVVDQLRFAGEVRYFPSRRAHIISILRSCLDSEDRVRDLITVISEQESDPVPLKQLVAVLSNADTAYAGAVGTMPSAREPELVQDAIPRVLRTRARDHFRSEIDGTHLPSDADARLLGTPAITAVEMRRRGADPDLHGLIRLWPEQGAVRLPSFQFTPTGEVRPLVLEINILLGVAEDPWGVADWWLSPNTWLTGVPADLLDNIDEDHLRAAAIAAVEG